MADILEEKDLDNDDPENGNILFKVKKTVTLFCGLTYNDLGIFFPDSLELKEVLPKINKYLAWLKDDKKVNGQMARRNTIKINHGGVGLDNNGLPMSVFLCENDKGKKIRLETEEKRLVNCGYES